MVVVGGWLVGGGWLVAVVVVACRWLVSSRVAKRWWLVVGRWLVVVGGWW